MNIQPYEDRLFLRPLEAEEKTKGGIILPDTAKEKPQMGEVVAVGEGTVLESGSVKTIKIKVGDTVLYGKYSGTEVAYDGEEYLVVKEEDIVGVIKKGK